MRTVLLSLTLLLALAANAFAIPQPPPDPDAQRDWLTSHLLADMKAMNGAFAPADCQKAADLVGHLPPDQLAVAVKLYWATRTKTRKDANLYELQQEGYDDEQVNAAKAVVAPVLTQLQTDCDQDYGTLVQPQPWLAQAVYASCPGWCYNVGIGCPDWYWGNNGYLGCCFNGGYCGGWGSPLYNCAWDNGCYGWGGWGGDWGGYGNGGYLGSGWGHNWDGGYWGRNGGGRGAAYAHANHGNHGGGYHNYAHNGNHGGKGGHKGSVAHNAGKAGKSHAAHANAGKGGKGGGGHAGASHASAGHATAHTASHASGSHHK